MTDITRRGLLGISAAGEYVLALDDLSDVELTKAQQTELLGFYMATWPVAATHQQIASAMKAGGLEIVSIEGVRFLDDGRAPNQGPKG